MSNGGKKGNNGKENGIVAARDSRAAHAFNMLMGYQQPASHDVLMLAANLQIRLHFQTHQAKQTSAGN